MSDSPSRSLLRATLAVLIVVWGTTWSVILVSLEGFPPLTGASLRFLIAGLVLCLYAWQRGVSLAKRSDVWLWFVMATLSFSLSYGVVYWAEQWVPSGLTSVLYSTLPLFTVIFAYIVLPGERLGLAGLAGLALGFLGVGTIFSDELGALADPQVRQAAFWVLVAPAGAAIVQVIVKRWGHGAHFLSLTAPPMLLTALILGSLALVFERQREILWEPAPIAATLYLALAGSALTFTLYFWLLKHVSATQLSMIAYAIPVVAVAIGTIFVGEPLTTRMILGSVLVVIGVALAVHPKSHPTTDSQATSG